MRDKLIPFYNGKDFLYNVYIVESKKRMYIIIMDKKGVITDYSKKIKDFEGYFLIY